MEKSIQGIQTQAIQTMKTHVDSGLLRDKPENNTCICGAIIEPMYHTAISMWSVLSTCEKCLKAEAILRSAENEKLMAEEAKSSHFNRMLINTNIPKRHALKRFEHYEFSSEKQKSEIFGYIENFQKNSQDGVGMLLVGKTGTGKTHLAVSLCIEIYERFAENIKYVNYVELLEEIKASFTTNENSLDKYKHAGLLVIDDLGADVPKEWSAEKLYYIINHRYNAMLPTIITSNLTFEELKKRVGDRVYGRLRETSVALILGGSDRRMQ